MMKIPASLRSDSCPPSAGTGDHLPPDSMSIFTGMRIDEPVDMYAAFDAEAPHAFQTLKELHRVSRPEMLPHVRPGLSSR